LQTQAPPGLRFDDQHVALLQLRRLRTGFEHVFERFLVDLASLGALLAIDA
jgi:hypothetical protein